MVMRRRGKRSGWLYVFAIAIMWGMFAADLRAQEGDQSADVRFSGYLESNLVLRDENGVQYGFLDHLNGVQQRNTLKFDVDIDPKLEKGNFSISNVHLTYRGAYDSIYDLRANKFTPVSEKGGPTRFDYGLRDVRFENDLREAFVDFTYMGPLGTVFFRPGRQLVSWGEASGASTLLDVINPKDQSYQLFFQNPDDVKIPLWMARLNYSLPPMPGLGINFEFLWVPDIRPAQFGPLDVNGMRAPYVSILFGGLRPFNVLQDVPTEKQEYGAKITADIGDRLSVSAAYFRDVNNDGGVVFGSFPPAPGATVFFTHNVQDVFGGYFSYHWAAMDAVIRGEVAHHTADPIARNGFEPYPSRGPTAMATFSLRPTTRYMLALDKKYLVKWITPNERTSFGFEWIRETINAWDGALFDKPDASKAGSKRREMDIFSFNTSWSLMKGRLLPLIALTYIPSSSGDGGGSGMSQTRLTWQISNYWYSMVALQAFWGDTMAKTGFAGLVPTSELTFKIGRNF